MQACRRPTASARSTQRSLISTALQAPLHVGWTIARGGPRPPSPPAAPHRCPPGRAAAFPPPRCAGQHWADDAGFDIARHVHGVTLAPPGGAGELRELAGALLVRPLDPAVRSGGCTSSAASRRRLGRRGPGPPRARRRHRRGRGGDAALRRRRPRPGAVHGRRAGAGAAAVGPAAVTPSRAALEGAGGRARATAATAATAATLPAADAPARGAGAPATALDRSATHRRAVGFGVTSLEGAREAGRRHGATINDVLLAAADARPRPRAAPPRRAPADGQGARPGQHPRTRRGRRHGQPHLVRHGRAARRARPTRSTSCARVRTPDARRKAGGGARPLQALPQVAELLPGAGAGGSWRAPPRARRRSTSSSPTCPARRSSST